MVTTKDIAKKLGFSVSTVGRALSGDARISERTKHAVRAAAEELGYVGNLPARMMRGGSSNLIGLILPDIQNDFFASIAQALSESCDRQGYRIVLSITGDDPETEVRHIRDFVGARVAGIILVPSADLKRESIALLRQVPHVQLLRYAGGPDDLWFGIDDSDAMERATSHLLDLGHRRIAYVAASERLSTGRRRLEGVHNAYRKRGIPPSSLATFLDAPTLTWGERAVHEMLALPERPTAILSGSAHVTMGIIVALRRAQIAIPDQMSVIGFGDPNWCEWWQPPITVIRPPIQSLAVNCALWFMDRLRTPEEKLARSYHATSSSELILRSSTGTPASR
ncbi:LacI family DNA-binding transcriptional regulator [Sphingopyxis sp. DBS4]|uniref:LacI family DNA-binding transcriptional regulator n=1 Tax=Sphingopyxis sp. DBS4 TaxID=2968500 RepID=UPI00214A8D6B|nr:LacI family DNA-binding transcriptional regulator [Sphingopyxis sp. DBS4]